MDGDINMEVDHQNINDIPATLAPAYKTLPPQGNMIHNRQYEMRHNMQEIIPSLFLGPYASASKNKLNDLKAHGITHIICVRHIMERNVIRPMHLDHFKYLVIEIVDYESLIPHCLSSHGFLEECFNSGGKALVHGNTGNERSASLVVAYVMAIHGVTLDQAISYVHSKRCTASPSLWQLQKYERVYPALHGTPRPQPVESDLKMDFDRLTLDSVDKTVRYFRSNFNPSD